MEFTEYDCKGLLGSYLRLSLRHILVVGMENWRTALEEKGGGTWR